MNKKIFIIIAIAVIVILTVVLIMNLTKKDDETSGSLIIVPENGSDNIVINPNNPPVGPQSSSIDMPEHVPSNLLEEEKVKNVAESFIKEYYTLNKDNYKTYYESITPYLSEKALNNIQQGHTSLFYTNLNINNIENTVMVDGNYSKFGKIISLDVIQNDQKAASIHVKTEFSVPPLDYEEAKFSNNIVIMHETLYIHVNADYLIDIVSIKTYAEPQNFIN